MDVDSPPLTKQVTYVLNVNRKCRSFPSDDYERGLASRVVDRPHFHDFDGYADVKENQSFNVTLEASAYPMPIIYTWFHPTGRQLFTDQSRIFINQGQLSMTSVQKSDLGMYRCVANNSYGSTEANFTLNVLCKFNANDQAL